MTKISIDPNSDHVLLDIELLTPQQFFYTVEVADIDGNVKFSDEGQWDQKKKFDLGQGTELIDLYLNIHWKVIDPRGIQNKFIAAAIARQSNIIRPSIPVFKGKAADIQVSNTTFAHFI